MAGSASDYHRGDQDITEQAHTFHMVMAMTKWGCLVLAAAIAMLVVWFAAGQGFFTGLIVAVVILVIGVLVLRRGGGH